MAENGDLRHSIEKWFRENGVPQFAHRHNASEHFPDLRLLLCAVFAYEIGVAPFLELSVTELITAHVVLIGLTITVFPVLRGLFDHAPFPKRTWDWVLRFAILVGATAALWHSDLPHPLREPWVDFAILMTAFATGTVLASMRVWAHTDREVARYYAPITYGLGAAVVFFAADGSALFDLSDHTGGPQGVPALVLLLVLLVVSHLLARASRASRRARPDRGDDEWLPDSKSMSRSLSVVLAVLVLGFETAILPRADVDEPLWPVALLLVALFAARAVASRADPTRSTVAGPAPSHRDPESSRRLILWLALPFVFTYPIVVAFSQEIDVFGTRTSGVEAFLVTAALNLVSLGAVGAFVLAGLDRIVLWSWKTAWSNLRDIAEATVHGLPFLLVFTTFFLIQAELWEAVTRISGTKFLLLLLVLEVPTIAFMLLSSGREIARLDDFESWHDVSAATDPAKRDPPPAKRDPPPGDPFADELTGLTRRGTWPPTAKPRRLSHLNALFLGVVYQALVVTPVSVAATAVFYGLGRLIVPPEVAAGWIYGDNPGGGALVALDRMSWWEGPWARVAVALGVFSALYVATQVASDPVLRKELFHAADRGIKQRLAVRRAYLELVERDDERGRAA